MFDVIANRHGTYNIYELSRVLKKNGVFITQQAGAENDKDLIKLLLPEITESSFSEYYLDIQKHKFEKSGFEILECQEALSQPIKFYDVGALVWFAKIMEWEFLNFFVDTCLDNLYEAQKLIEKNGVIEGKIHRFYFVARKK